MSGEGDNQSFLSRWSSRKRAIEAEEERQEEKVLEASKQDTSHSDEERAAELAANRQAAEAFDLDTIDEKSDLSVFFKDGVPEVLKKTALAKLWRSNPIFANVDGLVDYGENYADPNLIMKTFTSAYQVGKGYLKDVLDEKPETEPANQMIAKTDEVEGEKGNASDQDTHIEQPIAQTEAEDPSLAIREEPEDGPVDREQTEPDLPKVSLRRRHTMFET